METFMLCAIVLILAGTILFALYAASKYEAPKGGQISYLEDSEDEDDEPSFSGAFPSYFDEMNTPAIQVCLFRNTADERISGAHGEEDK